MLLSELVYFALGENLGILKIYFNELVIVEKKF